MTTRKRKPHHPGEIIDLALDLCGWNDPDTDPDRNRDKDDPHDVYNIPKRPL